MKIKVKSNYKLLMRAGLSQEMAIDYAASTIIESDDCPFGDFVKTKPLPNHRLGFFLLSGIECDAVKPMRAKRCLKNKPRFVIHPIGGKFYVLIDRWMGEGAVFNDQSMTAMVLEMVKREGGLFEHYIRHNINHWNYTL
ncbi:MAG: hypothetical protein KGL39_08540 [Patescibacteria group bacterium]|nr:hypothetical protein [Patescibacteria group bacterium]